MTWIERVHDLHCSGNHDLRTKCWKAPINTFFPLAHKESATGFDWKNVLIGAFQHFVRRS